ncbi:MAG: type II secretion system protein [Atribacterota bacterium]|nr:type II secretion system protein [Atribacterota bacterium]MDD4896920.1 type II secretion system protein [Atribacterota bacterium]
MEPIKRYKMKNKKGFTLIELMVVVAIIGILALIGLRIYAGQQNKSKDALLKGNVSTIHSLIQSELADNTVSNVEVWGMVDNIINKSGIHLPAGSPQTTNIPGMGATEPDITGNGGWVFVFVDDVSNPAVFYINGVNAEESGWVFENHLEAKK